MTLGEFLKQQRAQHGLSQADLAEQMGIEQSYLSKLESDRSMPSADIFTRWLNSLNISLSEVLQPFDHSYVQGKLRQIPQVAALLNQRSAQQGWFRGAWVIACCFFIALSVPLFYLGFTKTMFTETAYEYESPGVVFVGENPDIYRNWRSLYPSTVWSGSEEKGQIEEAQKRMTERQNPDIVISRSHRGSQFNQPLAEPEGYSRTYYLGGELSQPRLVNSVLQAIGLFLFVLGVVGLLAERKFFVRA
ncbi:helix-turn-helix domain-containing protein [Aliidiomarina celeris]|uniref:helix-turn-helix domain-containing protein n=1 Tax=Aliidiomarina celeris TaxID=2249428 RepID=UPI000DE95A2F|nr:helix-turn-helix transcriptional regulator [Aliidiomarina celeris]